MMAGYRSLLAAAMASAFRLCVRNVLGDKCLSVILRDFASSAILPKRPSATLSRFGARQSCNTRQKLADNTTLKDIRDTVVNLKDTVADALNIMSYIRDKKGAVVQIGNEGRRYPYLRFVYEKDNGGIEEYGRYFKRNPFKGTVADLTRWCVLGGMSYKQLLEFNEELKQA